MEDLRTNIQLKLYRSGIVEKARQLRLASFDRLAAGYGLTREELVELFLPGLKKSVAQTLAYYEKTDIDPLHKQLLEGVRNPDDYWEYINMQEEYKKAKTIDAFFDNYRLNFPGNKPYLQRIGLALPTPVLQAERQADVENIMIQVPLVFTYDLDFNAFVSEGGPIRDVPFIGLHFVLFTVLDVFIVHTLSMTFLPDPERENVFKIKNAAAVVEESKSDTNAMVILSCVDMLLGKYPVLMSQKRDPLADGKFYYSSVPTVTNFVLFHEYGHFMLGHLEQDRHPHMEFEADSFALIYTLDLLKSKKGSSYFILFSLASLYILLFISEKSRGAIDPNYPPVMQRVAAIVKQLSNEYKKQFINMWNYIIYAVNEPLVIHRQIEIPFLEYQEPS